MSSVPLNTRAAVAAVSLALGLAGCGATAARSDDPAAAARPCARTVQDTLLGVARRVYAEAARGPNVAGAARRLARSSALAAAVARDDPHGTEAALRPLLHHQIGRITVTRRGRVLANVGSGPVLAPIRGVIRDGSGTPVGRYRFAVGADAGLARYIRALTGAQVVMRAGGHRVAATAGAPDRSLPDRGTVTARGVTYTISSFRGTAFSGRTLRVWVVAPPADPALCGATPAATAAAATGAIGERLMRTESAGAATARVLRIVAHDRRFVAAVAADDPAALRARIVHFFRDPSLHVVRIRAVTAGGTLVNDVGGPYVLAPASATLPSDGRTVGTVTLSIQDDTGYIKLMHRLAGADVVLRTPAGPVPGSNLFPGAARIPDRGPVTFRGRRYEAFGFPATAFPSGSLHVSLLLPPQGRPTS